MEHDWLPPLPIKRDPQHPAGYLTSSGELITLTFAEVANQAAPLLASNPLPHRQPEVRSALALTLRYAFDPAYQGKGPWLPTHQRYQPHKATIATLLAIKLWQESEVLAAAYSLWLPRHRVAGTVDAVLALKDGSIAIVSVFTEPLSKKSIPTIQVELGGYVSCLIDQRIINPDYGIAIWATPTAVSARKYSAQECLQSWVDGIDLAKLVTRPVQHRGVSQ